MYDHIKVGDLIYLKRKITPSNDNYNNTCVVLYKEKCDEEFLFELLYKNKIKVYNTSLSYAKNIDLELLLNEL